MRSRRALLQSPALAAAVAALNAHALEARRLDFPIDHGAHTDFRTEWWYVTGYAYDATSGSAEPNDPHYGFQITFFRSRVPGTQGMRSRLAAQHLLFAHAAITDLRGKKLWHDDRITRWSGDTMATHRASIATTDVRIGNWRLFRNASGNYEAQAQAKDFALALNLAPTQTLLLQGKNGLSRKGPEPKQASYYYSQPHLGAGGHIEIQGKRFEVRGTAWLDHEWSQEIMPDSAIGWDWVGMNLFDGSAITGFQLRHTDASAVWSGGSYRSPPQGSGPKQNPRLGLKPGESVTYNAGNGEVRFFAQKAWKSPRTQASYPIEWALQHPAQPYRVRALLDAQELDSSGSTGTVYWEGLSELSNSSGRRVGLGYLEMTGYAWPLRL